MATVKIYCYMEIDEDVLRENYELNDDCEITDDMLIDEAYRAFSSNIADHDIYADEFEYDVV
jgi:hypothetical protein